MSLALNTPKTPIHLTYFGTGACLCNPNDFKLLVSPEDVLNELKGVELCRLMVFKETNIDCPADSRPDRVEFCNGLTS